MSKDSLSTKIKKAEQRARIRDFRKLQLLKEQEYGIDMNRVHNLLSDIAILQGNGFYIGKKKSPKNKIRFVQFLQRNWLYLNQLNYLTVAEKALLIDIIPYVDIHSNTIVDDIKKKKPIPLNLKQLASTLGIKLSNLSPKVSSLHNKGIIYKAKNEETGAHYIVVNPNILFSGTKDKLDKHLIDIYTKFNRNEVLDNLPDKLF